MDKKVHIWIDEYVKEKIQKYCDESEITLSQLTRKLLTQWVESLIVEPKLPLTITQDSNNNQSTIIRILTINSNFKINERKDILSRFNELNFHWLYVDKKEYDDKNKNLNIYIWQSEIKEAQKVLNEIKKGTSFQKSDASFD